MIQVQVNASVCVFAIGVTAETHPQTESKGQKNYFLYSPGALEDGPEEATFTSFCSF